jgi:DNA repair exonuclease SbcCD ATPase subunit
MVEPIMYLAIGFLIAMLFALMLAPLVHHRAVRLTKRRLEAATPLSMAEIQADKDQLRAEFAMSARKLEMSVDQLKNKTTAHLAEIGKKSDAVNRLKLELGEKAAAIFDLEAREAALKEKLAATETDLAGRITDLATAAQAMTDKQAELARTAHELSERSMLADSRQVDLLSARAQIDVLKNQVADTERELAATRQQLELQRGETATVTALLSEARGRVENLSQRVADLDRSLMNQVQEAERLGTRITELEAAQSDHDRRMAEREFENSQLRHAAEASERIARDLRVEVAALQDGPSTAQMQTLQAEKAAALQELQTVREERARQQNELKMVGQQAESAWATERVENALLRERINDIAAKVARLAMTLEGPNSEIEAILAADPAPSASKAANDAGVPAQATLADRIRALQGQTTHARQG